MRTDESDCLRNAFFIAMVLIVTLAGSAMAQTSLGTSFVYQGQLKQGGSAGFGIFDFQFKLYDDADPTHGNLLGTQRKCAVLVVNGLFSVELDFGDLFGDNALWLELGVTAAGACDGSAVYTTLSPPQAIRPAPQALYATNAGDSDTLDGQDSSRFLMIDGTTPAQRLILEGDLELTSGGIVFPDGTTMTTATSAAPPPRTPNVLVYESNSTWRKPPGLAYVVVELVGGGGGGGGAASVGTAGGGGGSGGYARKTLAASALGATEVVIVGAGGVGQDVSTPAASTAGGTTSFGSHLSATGGSPGGDSDFNPLGGDGGSGSGGDVNLKGAGGGSGIGISFDRLYLAIGGRGGGSYFGGAVRAHNVQGTASSLGVNSSSKGSGGSGAARANSATRRNGGNGSAGLVIVTEYF